MNDKVKEAEAVVEAAKAALIAAREALNIAEGNMEVALKSLNSARVDADAHAPKCVYYYMGRYSSEARTEEFVIVRRTAKEIRARRIGRADSECYRFRMPKSGKRWYIYPSRNHGSEWIELPESSTDDPLGDGDLKCEQ